MRYFIELSFNGKSYHGWQKQPDAISIQEVMERALSTLLRQNIEVVGAGRTDSGVHAKQIFAHFEAETIQDIDQFQYKLNNLLPKDIATHQIFQVRADAHARFDALSRSYEYVITQKKDAFNYDFTYFLKSSLDIESMNKAAKILLQYEDFKCFSKSKTDVHTYNCNVMDAKWTKDENTLIFSITANRFLRNMVRAVVGTLLDIGIGKKPVSHMHDVIKSRDRGQAGTSVPGHALYLTKVEYPETIVDV